MKIRNGFVSNSSSSSFCIYGFETHRIELDEAIEILRKFKEEEPDIFNSNVTEKINYFKKASKSDNYWNEKVKIYELIQNIDRESVIRQCENKQILEKFLDDQDSFYEIIGLSYHSMEYDGYAGRSWSSIKDDETGLDFKKSVERVAKYISGKKCDTIEEAWYNG